MLCLLFLYVIYFVLYFDFFALLFKKLYLSKFFCFVLVVAFGLISFVMLLFPLFYLHLKKKKNRTVHSVLISADSGNH